MLASRFSIIGPFVSTGNQYTLVFWSLLTDLEMLEVDVKEEEWDSDCVQCRTLLCLMGGWLQLTLLASSFCSSCLKRF